MLGTIFLMDRQTYVYRILRDFAKFVENVRASSLPSVRTSIKSHAYSLIGSLQRGAGSWLVHYS